MLSNHFRRRQITVRSIPPKLLELACGGGTVRQSFTGAQGWALSFHVMLNVPWLVMRTLAGRSHLFIKCVISGLIDGWGCTPAALFLFQPTFPMAGLTRRCRSSISAPPARSPVPPHTHPGKTITAGCRRWADPKPSAATLPGREHARRRREALELCLPDHDPEVGKERKNSACSGPGLASPPFPCSMVRQGHPVPLLRSGGSEPAWRVAVPLGRTSPPHRGSSFKELRVRIFTPFFLQFQ